MAAVNQTIAFSATIGGQAIQELTHVSCGAGVEQKTSRCTLTVLSPPSGLTPGADVVVSISVDGSTSTLYRGDYTGISWSLDNGRTINLECQGIYARLQRPWPGPERVYSPETTTTSAERVDAAIIRNLIEAYGIPPSRHEIFESEWNSLSGAVEHWRLGEIQPVVLSVDEPATQLIDAIDEVPGFATYDQLAGYIQRTRHNAYYAHPFLTDATFVEGQDGVRIQRLGPSYGEIVNRWVAQGLTYEGIPLEATDQAQNLDLDLFYPPEKRPAYIGKELRSDLLEYQHYCDQAAALKVQDTNRSTDGWEIVLVGEPTQHTLELQVTVAVQYASLGSSGTSRHRIISIQHELDANPPSFVTTIRTNGGTLV